MTQLIKKIVIFLLQQSVVLALCFSVNSSAQSDQRQPQRSSKDDQRFYDAQLHKKIIGEVKPSYSSEVLAYGASLPVDVRGGICVLVTSNNEGKVISAQPIYGFSLARDAAVKAASSLVLPIPQKQGTDNYLTTVTFGLGDKELAGNSTYLDKYLKQAEKEPKSWVAHCQLANFYLRAGLSKISWKDQQETANDYIKNAEFEARKAAALSPTSATVYHTLGLVYEYTGRYQEALSSYEQAIKNNPKFVEAYLRSAIMRCVLEGISYEQFVKDQDHLEGVAVGYRKDESWIKQGLYRGKDLWLPREPIYIVNKKLAATNILESGINQAIILLENSLKLTSDIDLQLSTLQLLAQVYRLSGQIDQTIIIQQRLVKLEQTLFELTRGTLSPFWENIIAPEDQILVHTNILGLLNETKSDYKEAILAFRQTIDAKINPLATAEAYIRIAAIYKKIGDEKSATLMYDQFIKILDQTTLRSSKDKAKYNHEKGLMAEAIGREQEAIALQKASAGLLTEWHVPHLALRRLYLKQSDQKSADNELDLILKLSPINIPHSN